MILAPHATAKGEGGQAAIASARRRQDADENAGIGQEALAYVAAHPQRHEDPVLAPIRAQDRPFQVGPVVHPLGVPLEGGAVLRADVDHDATTVPDALRLEARPPRRPGKTGPPSGAPPRAP